MKMMDWNGKRVVIVGAARQGLSLAAYLDEQGAQVILTDQKQEIEMPEDVDLDPARVEWVLGNHPISLLEDLDLLAVSGGVPLTIPLVQQAFERGIPVSNDSEIFLEIVPCPVIGITGSAGKTTTTLLVGKIAETAIGAERTWVGGNIGNPLIRDVDRISADDIAILELSSFQLELMSSSPEIACLLNITPNHLDRHQTMKAYTAAKARIFSGQNAGDIAVINREDPGAWGLRKMVKGQLMTFGMDRPGDELPGSFVEDGMISFWDGKIVERLFPVESIQLRGKHNLFNVLAASAVGKAAGYPVAALQIGVESVKGVEHRLEFVRSWQGADWYNDSIATAPERAMAAVQSFEEPLVLLAGGRDKDLPWDDFAALVAERVRVLILFGEAAPMIEQTVREASKNTRSAPDILSCRNVSEAVQAAAEAVRPGDVVLFSPGGTSFDEFIDFAERGELYKSWVQELN